MSYHQGGQPYPPPPPSRVRQGYSVWVVAAALLVGAGLGAVAVVATEDEPEGVGESDSSGILAELDDWEYVEEGDTGVPLSDFCEAVVDRGDANECFVVGDRAYFHDEEG